VSAIIRFVYLYNSIYRLTDYGENMYSSITVAFIWAEVEPNCSVIAACLPTYGPLFKQGQFIPRVFSSLRTKFGLSSKEVLEADLSGSASKSAGYYELDREMNRRGNGDIYSETDTKISAIQETTVTDIELR
jgi:hypothetical protein